MGFKLTSRRVIDSSVGIVLFLALWEALPQLGVVNPGYLSPPSAVLGAVLDLASSGDLLKHLQASLLRSFAGLLLAIACGVSLGLVMGWIATLLAAVIGFCVSYIFFRRSREDVARGIYEARHAEKPVVHEDAEAEDGAIDAATSLPLRATRPRTS